MIKKTQFITPVKSSLSFNKKCSKSTPLPKAIIRESKDTFSLTNTENKTNQSDFDNEFAENILKLDENNQELYKNRIKIANIRYEIRLNEDAIFAKRVAPIYSSVKEPSLLRAPFRYNQLQQLSKEQLAAMDDSMLADILFPFKQKQKNCPPKEMENFDIVKQFSPEDLIIIQNVSYATDMFFKLIDGDYKDKKERNNLLDGINHAINTYKE